MKKPLSKEVEPKLRELLSKAELPLIYTINELDSIDRTDSYTYMHAAKALQLVRELKQLIGYEKPDTELEQITIF